MKKVLILVFAMILCIPFGAFTETGSSFPFYIGSEVPISKIAGDIGGIFNNIVQSRVRDDAEAIEYYMMEDNLFSSHSLAVFYNKQTILLRRMHHIIVCDFISDNVVQAKEILLDSMSNAASSSSEEYYFAFKNGFVIVENATFSKSTYIVKYYNRQEKTLVSFDANAIASSPEQNLYAFIDSKGQLVYFDLDTKECGIIKLSNMLTDLVFIGKDKSIICLDSRNQYTFISISTQKAYNTSLPQNTIYVDENLYVTNDEFSIKTHKRTSSETLLKKANDYTLQGKNIRFRQGGNVLVLPNESVFIFNNGVPTQVTKCSQFIYKLDKSHRLIPKNHSINSYYNEFFDKAEGIFKKVSSIPKDFKTRDYHSFGDWELFCNSEDLVFTPTASLDENLYLLQSIGIYVYNVNTQTGKYITVIIE